MQATKNYIEALKKIDFAQASETLMRTAFENYINEFIAEAKLPEFKILQEGKRIGEFGVPDFRISLNHAMLGYIETKKTDASLDKILKSDQIKKYSELSQNLLITNYLEFVWIKGFSLNKGLQPLVQRETLCYLSDIENKEWKPLAEKAEKVEKLLKNFFSQAPEKISFPHDLALALAVRCKNLKDFINAVLTRQNEQNEKERLYDLYNAFKDNVFAELTISEFSDAFAQMLAYGLFLAGLNADNNTVETGHALSLQNAKYFIPSSFQLIKELINFLDELEKPEYKETKWIIDETISIINNIEWADLKQNMSFNRKKLSENSENSESYEADPYIYFYETFLATYDYNLRKSKGVYYTPPQVVNFIVRCIDEILINTFKLEHGFADRKNVTVLDFATGTGTFLLEIFKIVLENIPAENPEKRKMLIQEHILKNLFGFEYLIAPYTIAHLKLSQFLKENGYEFTDKDRLQVYLTNTLEPVDKQIKVPFMPQLSKETQTAQEIKDKPILVITGNPPYSGHSKNNSDWIKNEIKKYNFVDGKPLGEKNPKWLQDDYVKFIRFAQDKMDKAEQGIVGIITNHSFLDNPTFRGMRQSLMNTFDQLYFIDLHGNAKKKEKTPDGSIDQNVFDIEQGVCISLLIKQGVATPCPQKGIFHTDFWGNRKAKFETCINNSFKTVEFNELKPNSPFYLFVPQNQDVRTVYEHFWSVKNIFEVNGVGITTAHDNFSIDYEEDKLLEKFIDFKKTERYPKTLHKKFNVVEKKGWDILKGWDNLQNEANLQKFINPIMYRPFDRRFIFYEEKLVWRAVTQVMKHFGKENIGLVTVRQVAEGIFNHVFLSETLINFRVTISNKGGAYIFPLYRYNGNGNGTNANANYLFKEDDKKDNFTEEFRKFIKTKYKAKPIDKKQIAEIEKAIKELQKQLNQVEKLIISLQKNNTNIDLINVQTQFKEELNFQIEQKVRELKEANVSQNADYEPSPDEIFNYIYAVLHSPTYREKYAEFLKMDFPKIPFVSDLITFQKLSNLGYQLVQKHLLKEILNEVEYKNLGNFKGEGDKTVLKSEFIDNKLYINKSQYFETVPENVYNFMIGGYQVLDKYIKDRKNRTLTYIEIENIENIVKVLSFTIRQMELIDDEVKDLI